GLAVGAEGGRGQVGGHRTTIAHALDPPTPAVLTAGVHPPGADLPSVRVPFVLAALRWGRG
ncbi:hypothetical protein B7486_65540, partial [cyanobacterium TDX16]